MSPVASIGRNEWCNVLLPVEARSVPRPRDGDGAARHPCLLRSSGWKWLRIEMRAGSSLCTT